MYASELGYTLIYEIDNNVALDFYDFMITLDGAIVKPAFE